MSEEQSSSQVECDTPATNQSAHSSEFDTLIREFKEKLEKDEPYQALVGWFKFECLQSQQHFNSLMLKCYKENNKGFKDTTALFTYIHQLEDGVKLEELNIQESDLKRSAAGTSKTNLPVTEPQATLPPSSVPSSTSSNANSQTLAIQRKKAEFTCKVCFDEPVSVTFVPCGHLVACVSCASAVFECPVCRAPIRGTIKTFF